MIKKTLTAVLALVAAHAACAAAQEPASASGSARTATYERFTFRELDVDYDGVLSRREAVFRGIAADWFAAADANRDGRLSREEFRDAARAAPAQNGPAR